MASGRDAAGRLAGGQDLSQGRSRRLFPVVRVGTPAAMTESRCRPAAGTVILSGLIMHVPVQTARCTNRLLRANAMFHWRLDCA